MKPANEGCMDRIISNQEDQLKNLRPLTKQLYSKIHDFLLRIYQNQEQQKNIDKFKQKNILVLHETSEIQNAIKEQFEMTLNHFLKYMKVIGCRMRTIQKSNSTQSVQTHLIYFRPPTDNALNTLNQNTVKVEVQLPKLQKQEEDVLIKKQNNPYGQISLQLNLRKAELQERYNLEQQRNLKELSIEALSRNIHEANLISQYTIFSLLQNAIKDSKKAVGNQQKILDSIAHVKDRMDQCEGLIRQCLAVFEENQQIKNQAQLQAIRQKFA